MGFVVVSLSLFQSISGIGCASASAQAISQLFVQSFDQTRDTLTDISTAQLNTRLGAGCSLSKTILGVFKPLTDASQTNADDADYLASDERYDWCSGYALYRYTLEVNGVKELQVPQWERSLRRYCASEAEGRNRLDGYAEDSTERQPYDDDWGTIFDVDILSQFQRRHVGLFNFQDDEIPKACDIIKWGNYLSLNWARMAEQGYREVLTLNQGYWIGYNVQGSHDPTVRIDDEPSAMHSVSVNLDHRVLNFPTSVDLGKWLREVLAENCGAQKEDTKSAQPHRDTPAAGKAH